MDLRRARNRPLWRIEWVLLVVACWFVATLNGPWWNGSLSGRSAWDPGSWAFVFCVSAALIALHFLLLAPFMSRWTLRPLLSAVAVAGAAAAYYMRSYSVMLDPSMVQNILHTDMHESRELLSWRMVGSVLLLAGPPVAFLWWVRLARRPWPRALGFRAASMAVALVAAVLAILPVNREFTSLMRNHRELRYLVTPANLLYGLAASSAHEVRDAQAPREPVGQDARLVHVNHTGKHQVMVLVVGETARAANFGLLGYSRPTTPELAQLDVLAYRHATSCGTSTEISVPCLFSPWGRADYDERRIRNSEGLLDVLVRAGYRVKWLENQSGCKGVCRGAGVSYQKMEASLAPDLCHGDECYDGILLRRLEAELAEVHQDTVLVLHMMGNHGPAYFHRYPPAFRRFTPDCATAELRDCSREEVVNAYDNAILYTDHVLAGMVKALNARATELDSALLYVSDHGESLGEAGLYLHGVPYAIAPSTQTHVPLITWMSAGFASNEGIDRRCLSRHLDDAVSHDHVFHSMLGILDVQTQVYRVERDLFADCRGPAHRGYARN